MTQSFDGVTLDGTGSIVNFSNLPPSVLDIPVQIINSNSRTTPIKITDGENSVPFAGRYQILSGGSAEYATIKAKQGTTGTLVNNSQTVTNVTLKSVSLPQNLGGGALRCQLSVEYLGA